MNSILLANRPRHKQTAPMPRPHRPSIYARPAELSGPTPMPTWPQWLVLAATLFIFTVASVMFGFALEAKGVEAILFAGLGAFCMFVTCYGVNMLAQIYAAAMVEKRQ